MAPPANDASAGRRPRGPKGRMVFGSTRDLQRDPLGFLVQSRQEFGDVVRFRYFGPFCWYFFAHPVDVEHILVTKYQDLPKGVFGRVLDMILPNGLVSTDDARWVRQRRMMQPGFHAPAIAQLSDTIVSTAREHLQRWIAAGSGGRFIDVMHGTSRLSFDVTGRALLGSYVQDEMAIVDDYAALALQRLNYRLLHPLSPLSFLPTPTALRYRTRMQGANRVIRAIVARRRAQANGSHDVLDMLLAARDEDRSAMSDEEICDQVKTFLISGYETTGAGLGFFFYNLARHPDVERRVRAELRGILGDREPGVQDLQAMTYTQQALNETLRLYPLIPWLGRQARRACDVNGCSVPRRAVVCVSPYVTHRHPEFWAKPDEFDPDHFAPDAVRQRPRAAFFPFGVGPRHCIGQTFANVEMLLVIALVVPRWRFRLRPGAHAVAQLKGTLQMESELPMTIEPVGDGEAESLALRTGRV